MRFRNLILLTILMISIIAVAEELSKLPGVPSELWEKISLSEKKDAISCYNNLVLLSKADMLYSEDNNDYLALALGRGKGADVFSKDGICKYLKNSLSCPLCKGTSVKMRIYGYGANINTGLYDGYFKVLKYRRRHGYPDPSKVIRFVETEGASFTYPGVFYDINSKSRGAFRHFGGIFTAFLDGSVRWISKEDFPDGNSEAWGSDMTYFSPAFELKKNNMEKSKNEKELKKID